MDVLNQTKSKTYYCVIASKIIVIEVLERG